MMYYFSALVGFGLGWCVCAVFSAGRHYDDVMKAFNEGQLYGEQRVIRRMGLKI